MLCACFAFRRVHTAGIHTYIHIHLRTDMHVCILLIGTAPGLCTPKPRSIESFFAYASGYLSLNEGDNARDMKKMLSTMDNFLCTSMRQPTSHPSSLITIVVFIIIVLVVAGRRMSYKTPIGKCASSCISACMHAAGVGVRSFGACNCLSLHPCSSCCCSVSHRSRNLPSLCVTSQPATRRYFSCGFRCFRV